METKTRAYSHFDKEDFDDEVLAEEIELENKCKNFFNRRQKLLSLRSHKSLKKFLPKDRKAREVISKQEHLVRQHCSYLLRLARAEANNGYVFRNKEEQEKIIRNAVEKVADVFGMEDIYMSRRKGYTYESKNKKIQNSSRIPLKKDIAEKIYRTYLRASKLIPKHTNQHYSHTFA